MISSGPKALGMLSKGQKRPEMFTIVSILLVFVYLLISVEIKK
jgi:hypothetical protein